MTPRLFIVSILYGHDESEIERLVRAVAVSVRSVRTAGLVNQCRLLLGNCGSRYDPQLLVGLRQLLPETELIEFDANLGHSAGCNAAVAGISDPRPDDRLLFLNPDALLAPGALHPLLQELADVKVGAVDARQIPFEHPKFFDQRTREQSWASGACLATRHEVFTAVAGFDPEHFWSYCNDVDLSWRIRLAGWRIRYAVDAVVFHDKRVDAAGLVEPTSTETYFSTLGRLNLATRFGQPQIVTQTLDWVDREGTEAHRRAAAAFRDLQATGAGPQPLPGASKVAAFIGGEYGARRF